jgi:hypothetical protein
LIKKLSKNALRQVRSGHRHSLWFNGLCCLRKSFCVDSDWRSDIVEDLQEDGVLLMPFGPSTIRATTHRDVSMDETEEALSIIQAYADRQPAPAPS